MKLRVQVVIESDDDDRPPPAVHVVAQIDRDVLSVDKLPAGTRDPDPVDCSPDIMRGLPVFRGRRVPGTCRFSGRSTCCMHLRDHT
jgi:hypothetical protein